MKFRHGRDECYEYQEGKIKKDLKRLKKNTQRAMEKRKMNRRIDDCEDDEGEIEQGIRKYDEKKSNRLVKLRKYISIGDEMIERIKPSMQDRLKYSVDARHIRCLLESLEVEKLKQEERILSIYRQHSNDSGEDLRDGSNKKKTESTQHLRFKKEENEDQMIGEEERKDVLGNQRGNGESGSEHEEKKKKKRKAGKSTKGEFWCPELKKKKKPTLELQEGRETEIECKDSICSFDSQINLSGLALTKEEKKKIEKIRRSRVQSPTVETNREEAEGT